MRIRDLLAVGMLSLTAGAVHAEGFFDPSIRANLGVGKFVYRDYGFDASGGQTRNYNARSFDVAVGFELNRYLAAEAGMRLARKSNETYFDEPTLSNFEDNLDASNLINASVIGSLPLGDIFSLYGRVGLLNWKLEGDVVQRDLVTGSSAVVFESEDDGTDLFYGAGVGINVDTGLLRLEYQAAKLGDLKTSYITLGVVWRFKLLN